MRKLLYGMHDAEGAGILPSGGWCVALVSLSENPSPVDYTRIRSDINWLVRINWGYGSTGTIPPDRELQAYYARLSSFLAGSKGIYGIIIGNEPNHEQERPDNAYISPGRYASVFVAAYNISKRINSQIRVLPAAIAPYSLNWKDYMGEMFAEILKSVNPDGTTVHAYARSSDPNAIIDVSRMGPPLENTFSGFLTYRDAIHASPPAMHSRPYYITEFNELLPDGWENDNTGIVEAAYREVNWFNAQKSPEKIHCLCLYRWPKYDKWYIEGKQGVIDDFRYAVTLSYATPLEALSNNVEAPRSLENTIYVPSIVNDHKQPSSPSVTFEREIDERVTERGVHIVEESAGLAWRVKKLQWFNEQEADRVGPDHHILIDTLDENGSRLTGVKLKVVWPSGFTTVTSESKPGELASANYPMSASRNDYSVFVEGDGPSEMVRGIGMGMDYGSGFNPGIHTSTLVVFQKSRGEKAKGGEMNINIMHPVVVPHYRRVTQPFGVNKEFYSRFGLLGHNGVDFATPIGSEIRVVDAGQVIEIGDDPDGYGNYVKVKHTWGESLYAHLSRIVVNMGMVLVAGVTVGFSGNSGLSTGPHLHFGMRVNPYSRDDGWVGYIDPMKYLNVSHEIPAASTNVLDAIRFASNETGIEYELLVSLAWAESSFRSNIPDGLFQIGQATWSDWSGKLGVTDIYNPLHNARVAAHYLKWLFSQVDGDLRKALTAYNFGIGNVLNNISAPLVTQIYVEKVIHGRDVLKGVFNV